MRALFLTATLVLCLCVSVVHAQSEVKVMSYNIRLDVKSDGDNQWDKRKERVTTMIQFYEPDFVGLQEVLHHQKTFMEEQLKAYAVIGAGRDDGKELGEYACLFYKKDKYELIEQNTFWLSATPQVPSKGWDAALNRVCTYGLFKNKKTKQQFWVFNTHFDHVGKTARYESAKLIFQQINQVNTKQLPVILTGDFNSKPEDAPALFLQENMVNARVNSKLVHGNADTWNAFRFMEKPNGCIDYIFTSKSSKIQIDKFATITDSYELKYLSDHFPIYAYITITR